MDIVVWLAGLTDKHGEPVERAQEAAEQIMLLRGLSATLYSALLTCRPWIDDFGDGDYALTEFLRIMTKCTGHYDHEHIIHEDFCPVHDTKEGN